MTEAEKVLEGLGMVRAGVGFVSHPNVQADDKERIDAAIALIEKWEKTMYETCSQCGRKFPNPPPDLGYIACDEKECPYPEWDG